MKYNLSSIMKRAWEIKKEDKENIFPSCLKKAWKEVKELNIMKEMNNLSVAMKEVENLNVIDPDKIPQKVLQYRELSDEVLNERYKYLVGKKSNNAVEKIILAIIKDIKAEREI